MPRAEKTAPQERSPEVPPIDFSPEKFEGELDLVSETAWINAKRLPEAQQLPQYFKNLEKLRTRYLEIADAQQEPEEHKVATRALLGAFMLSQYALYGGLEKRGASTLPIEFEENIVVQSSIASYLMELNTRHKNNPAEATQKASGFWATQKRCLRVYFDRNPRITFEAWKNGILRDTALRWIIGQECKWDIVPQDDIRTDAIHKIDLVALSSNDIAYLFQIKPMENREDGAWEMEQMLPTTGNRYGDSHKIASGMRQFSDENGLDKNTTKGFLIRVSASATNINKQTGMPSGAFAQAVAGQLKAIDGNARQKSAA